MEYNRAENFGDESYEWVLLALYLLFRVFVNIIKQGPNIQSPHHAEKKQKLDIKYHAKFGEILLIPLDSEVSHRI